MVSSGQSLSTDMRQHDRLPGQQSVASLAGVSLDTGARGAQRRPGA